MFLSQSVNVENKKGQYYPAFGCRMPCRGCSGQDPSELWLASGKPFDDCRDLISKAFWHLGATAARMVKQTGCPQVALS